MGLLSRTFWGAAAGGLYGASGGGGMTGAIGGAVGGGLMGGAGVAMGAKFLGKRGGVAGFASRGYGLGVRGLTSADAFMGSRAGRVGSMYRRAMPFNRASRVAGGLEAGGAFIGRNAATINKYGGMAMGAIGTAAAAHIGSSVLSSNRGY